VRAALVAISLALAACGGPPLSDRQKDEVNDIARDVADAAVTDSGKIAELEERIADLESKLGE
jgi:hypothetical protein